MVRSTFNWTYILKKNLELVWEIDISRKLSDLFTSISMVNWMEGLRLFMELRNLWSCLVQPVHKQIMLSTLYQNLPLWITELRLRICDSRSSKKMLEKKPEIALSIPSYLQCFTSHHHSLVSSLLMKLFINFSLTLTII
jgi:hypothetical protein